ncbi:polysaccharide deacetylase family protein [Halospeciosus flavus]|uniref:Polysaccharide deacetylase family protein n=1 Tax=Halospeciosus flavus TaxID=3032283 RepID=A0ABD5Z117_9EURY|nr:polysaccharide deacetylase family protein [Halospeciosus flavus]
MEPTVVFVYDDGPIADYETAYPVHQRFDAPACIAVVSEWLGTSPGPLRRVLGRGTEYLDESHVRELADAGWEVLSHGAAHRPLDATRTTARADRGDRVLHVETDIHGREQGDTLVVETVHGETRVTVGRASHLPGRTAIVLRDPLVESVPDGASVRFAEEVVRDELETSKRDLEALGVSVDDVALPYSRYGPTDREVVPEVYDGVANAALGGVNIDPTDPYDLRRQYLGRDALTDEQLERFLETVRDRNALALFGGHSHRHVDADRIADALGLAREFEIRVTTLRDALASLPDD